MRLKRKSLVGRGLAAETKAIWRELMVQATRHTMIGRSMERRFGRVEKTVADDLPGCPSGKTLRVAIEQARPSSGVWFNDFKRCSRPTLARLTKIKSRKLWPSSSRDSKQKKVVEEISREEDKCPASKWVEEVSEEEVALVKKPHARA
ncbi:hypothetical protein Adt_35730 [Abeliophyllum distichum]|uniref:Uncharacterized protein n=1 Tax=Abeliophyllum distichum TaxID=126358 RepID=A0ABD1QFJ5_9LAMI